VIVLKRENFEFSRDSKLCTNLTDTVVEILSIVVEAFQKVYLSIKLVRYSLAKIVLV